MGDQARRSRDRRPPLTPRTRALQRRRGHRSQRLGSQQKERGRSATSLSRPGLQKTAAISPRSARGQTRRFAGLFGAFGDVDASLTFIQYEAGTGTAVEQYDLTTGRGTFDDISFRGTVRASLNDGPPLAANSDGDAAWITEEDYYSKTYASGTKPLWRERVVVHVGSKTETFATYGPVHNNPVPVLSHPFVISGLRITQHTVAWVYNGRTIRHRLRAPRAHRR